MMHKFVAYYAVFVGDGGDFIAELETRKTAVLAHCERSAGWLVCEYIDLIPDRFNLNFAQRDIMRKAQGHATREEARLVISLPTV